MWVRLGIVSAASWLVGACYHPSPQVGLPCSPNHTCPGDQVCDLRQDPPTCVDELVDGGVDPDAVAVACSTSAGCPSQAPVCDPADKVCRTCVADSECDGACHELTGECFAEANVIYASPTGADNLTCAKSFPCATITTALQRVTATRGLIRVADGSYPDEWNVKRRGGMSPPVIISGTDIAPSGAVFTLANAFGDPQTDPNTTLVLEGVTIKDAQQSGLVVRGTATLSHVAIEAAGGIGVDARLGSTLILLDSRIEGGVGVGISSTESLEVERSQVLNNAAGGITASGGFTIVNTVIANNGMMNGGTFGGARLAGVPGKAAVFRFNTVTKNIGGSLASGVQCESAIALEDSIVHSNIGLLSPEIGASCSPMYCLLATAPGSGNNVQGNPMFVNAASDFHVAASSPAIDRADPAATETVDFEGGRRPQGNARDIGADEQP